VKTLLFVGGGRHQRRGILRAQELGHRVVAVDRRAEGPGMIAADIAEPIDFSDVDAVIEVARRHGVDGAMTVSADRAVPIVAAIADALGLPGIGTDVAHAMTHKVVMRRLFAEHGVPQPRYAAVHGLHDGRIAAETVGFPAVLKPANSGGQRGLYRLESSDDLDAHLHSALAESPTQEAILEEFTDGLELNGIAVVRDGEVTVLTLSDRLRPEGPGFGVGWIHLYPTTLYGDALAEAERVAVHSVRALGLENGIAFPQLLAKASGEVVAVEVAARIPGGQMADVVREGTGIELLDIAILQALGESVPDALVTPSRSQPLAVRFLTAEPGPLPAGTVTRVSGLERVLAFPGVRQAEVYFTVGETIRPVRLDGDRRGYVLAIGDTNLEALEQAEAAARLLEVEVE
jgi:biotin carboxylase